MSEKLLKKDALDYHSSGRKGKIEVIPTKPYTSQRDLSLAYSPGVAEPCLSINKTALLVNKTVLLSNKNNKTNKLPLINMCYLLITTTTSLSAARGVDSRRRGAELRSIH